MEALATVQDPTDEIDKLFGDHNIAQAGARHLQSLHAIELKLIDDRESLTIEKEALQAIENKTILSGLEGSNEKQRSADLADKLARDDEHAARSELVKQIQREIAELEAAHNLHRRLYRLETALLTPRDDG